MKTYEQEKLVELVKGLQPALLTNTPDVYALGLLYGTLLTLKSLGYTMNKAELLQYNKDYDYLRNADTEDELGTLYTNRLDIHITYLKNKDTLQFTADGIRFNCECIGTDYWCTDIVIEDAVKFESLCFFYNDWLEDVLETVINGLEVTEHSVKYELFACGIAKDLSLE